MLTGDENIVDLNFTIFWIINDAKDFLFNVRNPEITIKSIGESVMREKIGQTPIDPILSEGKSIVEEDVKNKVQSVLDYYKSGVLVTQVQLQKADPPELSHGSKDVGLMVTHFFASLLLTVAKAFPA